VRQDCNIGALANFEYVLNEARYDFFIWAVADDSQKPSFLNELYSVITSNSDIIIVPTIFWVVPRFGVEGAAGVWVSLNAFSLTISIHLMFRKILRLEKMLWYTRVILKPLSLGLVTSLLLQSLWPDVDTSIGEFLLIAYATVLTLGDSLFTAKGLRQQAIKVISFTYTQLKK
jgi:hypothetical protein